MSDKQKITLSDTVSNSELDSFDELIDEGLESTIGSNNAIKTEDDVQYTDIEHDVIEEKVDIFDRKDKLNTFEDKNFNGFEDINEKMLSVSKEFEQDIKLTIANLSSKALNEAYLKARWTDKALAAKRYVRQLNADYKNLKSKLSDYMTKQSKDNSYLGKQLMIEKAIDSDERIIALKNRIEDAKLLEEQYICYKQIVDKFGYTIRNSIDTLNFERGM